MFVYKVTLTTEVILHFEDEPSRQEILDEAKISNSDIVSFNVEELSR
jgi:hypothetical protein